MQELRLVYNSNLRSRLEFQVVVEDRFAQKSIDMYRGFVQLFTDSQSATAIDHQCRQPAAVDDTRGIRPTVNKVRD